MKYTFGASHAAASRLEAIARFFNPRAAQLIGQYVANPVRVAVDLGCGPGFTTDMLHRATRAQDTYGLDNSAEFLALARDWLPHCHFFRHDLTQIPFPITADVMYVRFVLSHLPNPVEVVRNWVTQLAVGGILVIEEVEGIDTEIEVFKRYLLTSEALVASQGTRLFVGGELADRDYHVGVLLDERAILPVPDGQAATWFLPNTLTVWRESQCVLERLGLPEIAKISNALQSLATSGEQRSHITWKMRRLVLKRAGCDGEFGDSWGQGRANPAPA
jgi:trans-aconitate 2-methyltransferase